MRYDKIDQSDTEYIYNIKIRRFKVIIHLRGYISLHKM